MRIILFSIFCIFLFNNASYSHESHGGYDASRPDSHAPIGVMGDHNHKQGEVMLSYRYATMGMDGNRSGTDEVSNAEISQQGFMIAPQDMQMEMHMVGAMVGVTDDFTVMAMIPYKYLTMDHEFVRGPNTGRTFTMESQGFGDFKLSGLVTLKDWGSHKLMLNPGVSFPTGSIGERDVNSVTNVYQKLPYPMQLGSGTFDLLPGVTYTGYSQDWSWGSQLYSTIRLGENNANYTLGHEYGTTAWGARKLNNMFSISARVDGKAWGGIDGADAELNPAMIPTARPDMRGGERVDVYGGINFTMPKGMLLEGNRLALEAGAPVWQRLDGPQLETDYRIMVGWQKSFN